MDLFILLFLFVFGTLFGSFLNVLIDRFCTERSVVKGRSYCEKCKKTLSSKELIPLLSYLVQKGKCIHCKAKIPFRLFLVELLIGILLPSVYLYIVSLGLPLYSFIFLFIVFYAFTGIIFADLEYGLIPDNFLIISIPAIFALIFILNSNFYNHLLSGIGAFLFFYVMTLYKKGQGMGFGDVKLAFVIGLFLGYPFIIISLYLAFLTGALISIILVLWKKVSFSKGTIPFGPFMILATVIAFFLGDVIIQYLLPFLA